MYIAVLQIRSTCEYFFMKECGQKRNDLYDIVTLILL